MHANDQVSAGSCVVYSLRVNHEREDNSCSIKIPLEKNTMQHSDTICDDVCVAPCPLFVYLPFLIEKLPSCGAAGGRIRGAPWWSRRFFRSRTVQRNLKSGAREVRVLMRRGVQNANFVFGTRLYHLPSGSRAVNREAARSACFPQEHFGLIPPTHLHRLLLVSKQLSHGNLD